MQKALIMQVSAFSEYKRDPEIPCGNTAKPQRSYPEPPLLALREEELRKDKTEVQV